MFPVSDDRAADKQYGEGLAETQRQPSSLQRQRAGILTSASLCQFISPHFCIKRVFITLCPAGGRRDQVIEVQIQTHGF